jgi:hypothetical protein
MEHLKLIVDSMRKYQKNNNIKGKCITNTQYLYKIIKHYSNWNVKAKTVFAVSIDNITNSVVTIIHIVIMVEDKYIIDPSYEVFSKNNLSYYDNVEDYVKFMNSCKTCLEIKNKKKETIKISIREFIKFLEYSKKINEGNGIELVDDDYYNKQADFIETINFLYKCSIST